MDEPFLRAERHRRLGLGIELDAEPVLVQLAYRSAQVRHAAAARVAMVARQQGGFAKLLDGDLRRRDVGIAKAEVDDVFARAPELELEPLDLREGVWGKRIDAPELDRLGNLGHAADRRRALSASRTATTSPITTSAGVGMPCAAVPMAPSGAVTTCSRSVVPDEITAAGVPAARPCSIRRSARRPTTAPPMNATSVPGTRASAAASSFSTSFAAKAVTVDETPRWVIGNAHGLGHGGDRRHAGHQLERHSGVGERERLLPSAAENERIAAFETDDPPPVASVHHEQLVHVFLLEVVARDSQCGCRRFVDELFRHEPVVDEHLAVAQSREPAHGDQLRVAGPGTDERDAHPSTSVTRPRKKSRRSSYVSKFSFTHGRS